jgi:hypothetical protein
MEPVIKEWWKRSAITPPWFLIMAFDDGIDWWRREKGCMIEVVKREDV